VIQQLTRKYSRHALPRPNLVYFLWRYAANGLRTWRARTSTVVDPDVRAIAGELAAEGIVTGRSDRFLTGDGQRALDDARARVLKASRSEEVSAALAGGGDPGRRKDFLVDLVSFPAGMAPDDPLLKVALDRKLLDVVSSYLGLWPCLYSVGAWLNYPTDAAPELSQLWHRDPEDLRLVKVFIYLVDVDEHCGPFTYIPRTHPFGAEAASAHRLEGKKRVADERMARVLPPATWRVCTGNAGTMILADTLGYHRGGKPTAGRRILITFTYTSGSPITDRSLWVTGMPAWISSGVQRWAVKPLLRIPRPDASKKKKTKKAVV
jgi:hypothetical protein